MRLTRLTLSIVLFLFAAGCTEVEHTDLPTEVESDEADSSDLTTRAQAAVDPDGPNWFVAGEGAFERVGPDGEPDGVAGQFVLGGIGFTDASAGDDRWIVVGDGASQPIDEDAVRLIEARTILNGAAVTRIARGPNGWLVVGENGEAQTLDALGEPTSATATLLSGSTISDAVWNGNNWIVAGQNRVAIANSGLNATNPAGSSIAGISTVRAVARVEEPAAGASTPVFVFGADSVARVSATGVVSAANEIESGLDLTFARRIGSEIVVGTADGRLGFFDPVSESVANWTDVIDGQAVTKVEWSSSEYLVLGEGGMAQRVGSDGATLDAPVQLSNTQTPVAAWYTGDRWLVGFRSVGLVSFYDDDLNLRVEPSSFDATILAADVGAPGILVGTDDGRVQLLNPDGSEVGALESLESGGEVRAVAWNDAVFLVAGTDGAAQFVGADGAPIAGGFTFNDGLTIEFAAWNGSFWLVGGEGNRVERIRPDGTVSGSPLDIPGFDIIYDAMWSGGAWLVAGMSESGAAAFALVNGDGTLRVPLAEVPAMSGPVYTVEFNGIEFILAGADGMIQRVGKEGAVTAEAINALNGFDIYDLSFDGQLLYAVGELGSGRRISSEFLPIREPLSLLNQGDARVAIWGEPRGFPGGLCLDSSVCFVGQCIGSVSNGTCCESACDRPCESCFEDHTGEPDGTCAPVVAGRQPPPKPGVSDNGCPRQSEGTCGTTGNCDGAGECAFFGSDITCAESFCSNGQFFAIASCSGAGACGEPEPDTCAPYVGCNPVQGCASTCAADTDCIQGFECLEDVCVEIEEDDSEARPDSPDTDDDDGGCSVVETSTPTSGLLALALLALGLVRLRRS